MIKIGLTGGIGSGKSEAARILGGLGAVVISADRLGHLTYRRGERVHRLIVEEFGPGVTGADGEIDRKALGKIIFSDPDRRKWLEQIVWPEIRILAAEHLNDAAATGAQAAVLEAAVLLEAEWESLVDEVWVVDAPMDRVLERLMERDGLNSGDAQKRVSAQISPEDRAKRADVLIVNDADLRTLVRRVETAWKTTIER